MGGGDLNLKKSWHPSTLRNVERVWKAEQLHEAEQKKIHELQRELKEERAREEMQQYAEQKGVVEKKSDRLDWMYRGPGAMVNQEDYLMGRPVDKTFEFASQPTEVKPTQLQESIPESIFAESADALQVDLAAKMREDPLFAIRKQEEENMKLLLNNPVKMKKLKELQQAHLKKKLRKEKRKHKKNKKSRRHSESDSTDETSPRSRKRDHGHSNDTNQHKKKCKRKKHSRREDESEHEISSSYRYSKDKEDGNISNEFRNGYGLKRFNNSYENSQGNERKSSHEPRENVRSLHVRQSQHSERSSSTLKSDRRKERPPNDDEKKRRLQEMMDNAKWREEQRSSTVKRLNKEEKEEQKVQYGKGKAEFVAPMFANATSKSSVESRIKSNIYNIQRTKNDLEGNFLRR